MAKKRRDKKRDPSTRERIMKAGKAALAIGAGAALLASNEKSFKMVEKAVTELYPTAAKAKKAFKKEMFGTRRKAMDYYNAYDKVVGKNGKNLKQLHEATKKEAAQIKIRSGKKTNLPGYAKHIKQKALNGTAAFSRDDYEQSIIQSTLDEVNKVFKNKYDKSVTDVIVKSAFKKADSISYKQNSGELEIGKDFLKEFLKKNNVDDTDAEDIIKTVLSQREKFFTDEAYKHHKSLMEEVAKKSYELAMKDKAKNTRDNLLLNKAGKLLGINNLEEKLLGSRAMTFGEFLEANKKGLISDSEIQRLYEPIKNNMGKTDDEFFKFAHTFNSIDELKRFNEANNGIFNDVVFDKNIRVRGSGDDMHIFDISAFKEGIYDAESSFNSTIIGKVLTKGIERRELANAPGIEFLLAGKKSTLSWIDLDLSDSAIEAFTGKAMKDLSEEEIKAAKISLREEHGNKLKNSYIAIGDKIYGIDKTLTDEKQKFLITEDAVVEGVYLSSNEHGLFGGVLRRMLGEDRRAPYAYDNPIAKALDINQDGESNFFHKIGSFFTKFNDPEWGRNRINRYQNFISSTGSIDERIQAIADSEGISFVDAMAELHEDAQMINKMFSARSSNMIVTDDAIAKMIDHLENNMSEFDSSATSYIVEMLNIALSQDSPEDMIAAIAAQAASKGTFSSGLSRIINNYREDADGTLRMLSIEGMAPKKIPIMDIELSETNTTNLQGILRKEIVKEALSDSSIAGELINNIDGLTDRDREALALLGHWSRFNEATGFGDFSASLSSIFNPDGALDKYLGQLEISPGTKNSLDIFLEEFKSDFGLFHSGWKENINENYYSEFNDYEVIKKTGWNPLQMLKDINDGTKMKATLAELNGGRNNLQNVSTATVALQYMINRLSYGVEESGFGLSAQSMGSPLQTITSVMTKRVLPAMMAYTAFDYLNDLSEDMTGVSILGAGANALRNIDVAGRKLAYSTGVGQVLNWWETSSVVAEYWTGDNHYQNAEERADWYENGYSPVRKSRFWAFGSASEFRGGDISFFQPNYYRRIHSDYKDKVLYGSNSEKWAHSIIPTPTHPLSTIRYLMDPYWLEKKHIDDAPTPLTGKMFSEGTFWGAILNPTVGEIIKPQIMLPEIKKRMTGKGHDVQGMLRKINERTKRRATENDDLLVVNGTDIRNATYVPYGNATADTLTVNQYGYAKGIDYMSSVGDISTYRTPDGTTYMDKGPSGYGRTIRRVEDDSIVNSEIVQEFSANTNGVSDTVFQILSNINNSIKDRAFGRTRRGRGNNAAGIPDSTNEGTYYYNNMVNEYNKYVDQYYSDKIDPSMINTSVASDLMADAKHSVKQLSGIYGFLGEQFLGENSYTLRYENAGSYSSFSRGFWDANIGGLGGGVMEIARRFFPSQDRSRVDYNPLVNNMPEWLPDNFHYGVPWTKVTKGEMRLPGKGYEAINELHPDEYGEYGAFDRYKILADVAPNSEEYKMWRNIAKHTVKDSELQQEMKEIEARKKRMSGNHEFYEYQYLKTNTKYETDVIKEIRQDGSVVLVSNKVLKLAGIEFNENYAGELNDLIAPGQKISYKTTDDAINDLEEGVIRNAAIFSGTENVNKKLIDMGVADRDITDTSAIGKIATISASQEVWGAIQEAIAHARIPIIHNKFLHIETALESFVSEQVNGANFQTWDHPIEGFIKPMLNEVAGQNIFQRALAVGYGKFHFNKVLNMNQTGFGNKAKKFASGTVLATLDPMAMMGGTTSWLLRLGNGRSGDGSQPLGAFSRGAKIGHNLGNLYWAYQSADNPFMAAASFGAAAIDIYNSLEIGEFAEQVLKKSSNRIIRDLATDLNWKKAGVVGAAVGLGVSALKNADFNKDRMFGKHMPKKYQKINEMNEYFDRLEFIKYKGLYEDAARKAALFEGSNIKDVFNQLDKNKKKISKLEKEKRDLLNKYNEHSSNYQAKVAEIDKKISGLKDAGNNMFKGGKYTKSAVAYKKAMESTIYGLSEGATKDEILAAVPDQYKDYFQSFMNVTDKSEQKKILSYLPDYMKRPLQLAWGMDLSDVDSNMQYFRSHKLPNFAWKGWKPNVNLKYVQMKTIENEGMLLADFGFYDSEKAKASYTLTPDIENYDQGHGGITTFLNLGAELRGLGVMTSNVSIERTGTPGFWISSDIKQSIEDRYEIGSHSIGVSIQGLVSNFI